MRALPTHRFCIRRPKSIGWDQMFERCKKGKYGKGDRIVGSVCQRSFRTSGLAQFVPYSSHGSPGTKLDVELSRTWFAASSSRFPLNSGLSATRQRKTTHRPHFLFGWKPKIFKAVLCQMVRVESDIRNLIHQVRWGVSSLLDEYNIDAVVYVDHHWTAPGPSIRFSGKWRARLSSLLFVCTGESLVFFLRFL